MRKIILTVLLFAGLASTGISQERPQQEKKTPEQRAQLVTEALSKRLSLNEKQKAELYKINLERANQMEKLHDLPKEDRKNAMSKMKEVNDASESKIEALLTESQKATYAEMKEKRKEQAKKHAEGDMKKKKPAKEKPEAAGGE